MVRVKSNLEGDVRRFVLPASPNFDALCEQIRSVYAIDNFSIKYKDEDDDLVTITTDGEFLEAISSLKDDEILRISVFKVDAKQDVQVVAPTESRAESVQGNDIPASSESPDVAKDVAPAAQTTEAVAETSSAEEPAPTSPEEPSNPTAGTSGNSRATPCGGANNSCRTSNHPEPTPEELLSEMVRAAAQIFGGLSCGGTSMCNGSTSAAAEEARISEVPRPTLVFGSVGSEVRQLQKVLTNLGYMTPADYRIRSGMYGPRTANAVARFRMECGLGYGVYDEAASGALRSLIESGVPATMSTGGGAGSTETTSQAEDKTETA